MRPGRVRLETTAVEGILLGIDCGMRTPRAGGVSREGSGRGRPRTALRLLVVPVSYTHLTLPTTPYV